LEIFLVDFRELVRYLRAKLVSIVQIIEKRFGRDKIANHNRTTHHHDPGKIYLLPVVLVELHQLRLEGCLLSAADHAEVDENPRFPSGVDENPRFLSGVDESLLGPFAAAGLGLCLQQ
jgi:hypothetical protein